MGSKSKPKMETILRRRRVPVKKDKIKKEGGPSVREKFVRLESIVKRARDITRNAKRVKAIRQKLVHKPLVATPKETKTVTLIMRNGKSTKNSCGGIYRALEKFNLTHRNSAVFVRLTDSALNELRIIRHFVCWGQPSLKSVKDILYKHGAIKNADGRYVALSDNRTVEAVLGQYGIVCVEDLVHELHSLGPHFDEVISSLGTLSFSKSRTPHKQIGAHFNPNALKCKPGETRIDAIVRTIN